MPLICKKKKTKLMTKKGKKRAKEEREERRHRLQHFNIKHQIQLSKREFCTELEHTSMKLSDRLLLNKYTPIDASFFFLNGVTSPGSIKWPAESKVCLMRCQ